MSLELEKSKKELENATRNIQRKKRIKRKATKKI